MKYIILGYLLTAIAFISLLFIEPMSALALFITLLILIVGPFLFFLGIKSVKNELRISKNKKKEMYSKITS
jgi:ABC-type transport system involved in cytochrome bd biosynthesis fused ATPase/permease subunit